MSYLAAVVVYVCLEQPLASLEALTYRKPQTTSTRSEVDLEADKALTFVNKHAD